MTAVPFESIRVRGPLRVIAVRGTVQRLAAVRSGHQPLNAGDTLPEGSRIRLEPGSALELEGEREGRLAFASPSGFRTIFFHYLDENELGHRLMK